MKKKRNLIFRQDFIVWDPAVSLIKVFSCFNFRKLFSERANCFKTILTKLEINDVYIICGN